MDLENIVAGFKAMDRSSDPNFYLNFLTAVEAFEDTKSIKSIMRSSLGIANGMSVLDVGCGHGSEALALKKLTGLNGRSVGIDPGASMIEAAKKNSSESDTAAEFQIGDAHELPFAKENFHACRSERVFMYLKDPELALSEMIRVTRPGGKIVIFDFDWDCAFIDGADPSVTRKFIRFVADSFPNGKIGSRLNGLFVKAGLKKVTATPHAMRYPFEFAKMLLPGLFSDAMKAGVISNAEARDWWQRLDEANQVGRFYAGVLGFIVQGQK